MRWPTTNIIGSVRSTQPALSKGDVMLKKGNCFFKVNGGIEALIACEAGARVPLGTSPVILIRLFKFALAGTALSEVRNQLLICSKTPPGSRLWFSCSHGFSTPLDRRRSSYPPSSSNLVLTRPTVHLVTCLRVLWYHTRLSATASPVSRVPHAPSRRHQIIGVQERHTW